MDLSPGLSHPRPAPQEERDPRGRTQEATGEQVGVGSTVRVRDAWGDEEHMLVAPSQSDPAGGRISIESPVGRALLGRRRGDRVEVQTPGGLRVLSIVEVAGPEPEPDHRSSGMRRP
ncbi:MAG: transcription elongation factor GreA [Chloroflexota bacterium]|nr:transcription elongation factor GreA [Chloroflexota bacterium]